MLKRIKQFGGYLYGLLILLLVALYSRQKKKTEEAESELAHEKAQGEIKLNEQAREAARANADSLVDEYHKLRGDDR
jgi:hypothetical protein